MVNTDLPNWWAFFEKITEKPYQEQRKPPNKTSIENNRRGNCEPNQREQK